MKLYTEEQVIDAITKSFLAEYPTNGNDILKQLTPIKLPSDEEIWEKIEDSTYSLEYDTGFAQGVKWVIEKLKEQDNA